MCERVARRRVAILMDMASLGVGVEPEGHLRGSGEVSLLLLLHMVSG